MPNEKLSILIVDDSYDMLEVLRRNLESMGHFTYQASAVADAIDILSHSPVDLLITDLHMPGIDGMQLLRYTASHFPAIPVLVITGYPSVKGAVEALKSGAVEYLVKPFTAEELREAVTKVLLPHRQPVAKGKEKRQLADSYMGITGRSEAVQQLIRIIERVKDNRATVLITGESGTGKELVARALHYKSRFSSAPFVAVNCGAIPEPLLESELFGYTKGSFTGAYETRAGFFQAADGGTIFLDEIGNASPAVQARLLRVIQEKEVQMIGGKRPQKIEVRIIAATNSDLYAMLKNGTFREDLYYRLNVIAIPVSPLRERREDIPMLVAHFLQKFSHEYGRTAPLVTDEAMQGLMQHSWPGNVRELENIIQRLVILADSRITFDDLPEYMNVEKPSSGVYQSVGEFRTLASMEREYIRTVLDACGQNKTKAAQVLAIDRKTLREKLRDGQ